MRLCAAGAAWVLCAAWLGLATAAQVQEDLESFQSWFSAQGGVATNVSLQHFDGMGIGLVASGATYDGLQVLQVPLSAVISDTSMYNALDGKARDLVMGIPDGEDRMAAFLMLQLSAGKASPWHAYLRVLPAHVPVTLWWTSAALESLHDESISSTSRRRLGQVHASFERLWPQLEPLLHGQYSAVSEAEDAWLWAHSIVSSRALTMHGKKFLVPFADFFNYAPHANLRDSDLGSHFLHYHRVSDTHFTVLADRVAQAGDQLAEDYGDNGNDVYLQYHGFVPDVNPFACWEFPIPSGTSLRKRGHPERKQALIRALLQHHKAAWREVCLIPGKPLPAVVLQVVHSMRASGPQLTKCAKFIRNPASQTAMRACFGEGLPGASLLRGVRTVLSRAVQNLPDVQQLEARVQSAQAPAQAAESELLTLSPGDAVAEETKAALQGFIAAKFALAKRRVLDALLADLALQLGEADGAGLPPSGGQDSAARRASRASRLNARHGGPATAEVAVDAGGDSKPASVVGRGSEENMTPFSPGHEAIPVPSSAVASPSDSSEATANALSTVVDAFNDWFDSFSPPVAAIKAAVVGDGMRLGVVAAQDIAPGEVYLSVPSAAIMSLQSASRCPTLKPVFDDLNKRFPRGDDFHQLLFHLMYETFVRGEDSAWAPYLATLPTSAQMGFPLFYDDEQLNMLTGSHVLSSVQESRRSILRKFSGVQKAVFSAYPEVFNPNVFTLSNYVWATAILDSRSIWWDSQRHLVPLLDLINCKEGPDARRVHSTGLDDAGLNAVTRAGWHFPKGSQLWENYGQPNHIYFAYHGFSMQPNSHDCVEVVLDVASIDPAAAERVQKLRWPATLPVCLYPPSGSARTDSSNAFGVPDSAMSYALQALDTNEEGAVEALVEVAQRHLAQYPTTVEQDEALLTSMLSGGESNTFINVNASIVQFRLGEKRLLQAWLAHVSAP